MDIRASISTAYSLISFAFNSGHGERAMTRLDFQRIIFEPEIGIEDAYETLYSTFEIDRFDIFNRVDFGRMNAFACT